MMMNLIYGTIIEIHTEDGIRVGTVRVSGALKKVPIDLIRDAKCGQKVLLCDNIAISKVEQRPPSDFVIRNSSF